ncbi:hypothetical protein CsSME_00019419 [Camellia sinensis var. sinensis]
MDEDASLKEVSVVEETEMIEGGSEVGIACEVGSGRRLCKRALEKGGARMERNCRIDDNVVTSGFIRSMSGSVGRQQGINLEVDLNRAYVESSWDGAAHLSE